MDTKGSLSRKKIIEMTMGNKCQGQFTIDPQPAKGRWHLNLHYHWDKKQNISLLHKIKQRILN